MSKNAKFAKYKGFTVYNICWYFSGVHCMILKGLFVIFSKYVLNVRSIVFSFRTQLKRALTDTNTLKNIICNAFKGVSSCSVYYSMAGLW